MQLIDIYKETSDGIALVTAGCIQTGEPALTKTVQSKFYTFSDGTVCCYPTAVTRSSMTLELECTELQATAIERTAAHGAFLFAGIRFGTVNTVKPTAAPPPNGYRAYLTGDVEICEKFAGTGLYSVKMPLVMDAADTAGGERYCYEEVPALYAVTVYLDGDAEQQNRYETRLIGGRPVFVRRSPLLTFSDTLSVSLTVGRHDSGDLTGLSAHITGAPDTAVALDETGIRAEITGNAALSRGDNVLDITCELTSCRAFRMRVPVYRKAARA